MCRRSLFLVVLLLGGLVLAMLYPLNGMACAERESLGLEPCMLNYRAIVSNISLETPQRVWIQYHKEVLELYHNPALKVLTPPPESSATFLV